MRGGKKRGINDTFYTEFAHIETKYDVIETKKKNPNIDDEQISVHTTQTANLWDRRLHLTRFLIRSAPKGPPNCVLKRKTTSVASIGRVVWNGLLTQAAFAGPGSCGDVPLCSVHVALPPVRNRCAAYSPQNSAPKQNLWRQLLESQTIRTMAAVCGVSIHKRQLEPCIFGLMLI